MLESRMLLLVGRIVAVPFLWLHHLQARVVGSERSFIAMSQLLSLFPDGAGTLVRRAFYQRTVEAFSDTCAISFGSVLTKPGARFGEHVYVGPSCSLGLVTVDRDVLIGDGVRVSSGSKQHGTADLSVAIREQAGSFERVHIGAAAWIGSGAIVLADVGASAIVGAGAVVVASVPAFGVVAGNPARLVRDRRDASASDGSDT